MRIAAHETGHAVQDGLDRSIQITLDTFQLLALTDDVSAALNPQPIHFALHVAQSFIRCPQRTILYSQRSVLALQILE